MQMMFNHLKTILTDALKVWPTAPVKLLYMEKLIVPKMQQHPDNPPPSVTVALEVSLLRARSLAVKSQIQQCVCGACKAEQLQLMCILFPS